MLLLTCLVIRSTRLLKFLVGHSGPPTIGLSFEYFCSEIVISCFFCSLITLCKISDLQILGQP